MVSPFPAFRTKWNCPGGEFLSTYLPAIFLLPEWMSTPAQPRAQGLAQDRGHFPHAGWPPLPMHGHAAEAKTTFRRNRPHVNRREARVPGSYFLTRATHPPALSDCPFPPP